MKLQLSFLIISYLKLAQAQIPTAEEGEVCGAGVQCSQFGLFIDGNGMRRGLVCRSSSGSNVLTDDNETGVCRYVVPLNEGCGVERLIEGKMILPSCNQGNGRLTCLAGTCQNIAILGEPCEQPNPMNANGPAKCAEGLTCVKRELNVPSVCEETASRSTVVQSSSTTITVKPTQTATVVKSTVVYSPQTTGLVEGGASGVAALSFTGMIALLFF